MTLLTMTFYHRFSKKANGYCQPLAGDVAEALCADHAPPGTMSEENEQVFRRMIEDGFNKGNLAALDALCAPNFVEHQDGFVPPNIEGVKGEIVSLRTPFPDLKLTIEEIVVSCAKSWARITARGTHQAPFMGRPPTGKSFAITVFELNTIDQ